MIRPSAARNLMLAEAMAVLCFAGCQVGSTVSQSQSNSSNQSAIVVTVSPVSGSVQTGMSFQFTATVQADSANKGVTWSIQSAAGCDCGTIDSTGKYSAPKTPHYAPGLRISATSVSDPTKSATSVIFVTPAPNGVGVFPSSASVPVNGVQQFSATGTPFSSNPVVTWSVSGNGCVAANCGTIDSTGKYTAPASSPVPPGVTIKATSVADPSVAGFANVTIVAPANNPDNAKLNGHYAFLLRGYDGDGNVAFAGSFVADGTGNISSGIGDFVFSSGIYRAPNLAFTGNYSVSPDNRASITIASPTTWVSGLTLAMSLASFDQGVADRGQIATTPTSGRQAFWPSKTPRRSPQQRCPATTPSASGEPPRAGFRLKRQGDSAQAAGRSAPDTPMSTGKASPKAERARWRLSPTWLLRGFIPSPRMAVGRQS